MAAPHAGRPGRDGGPAPPGEGRSEAGGPGAPRSVEEPLTSPPPRARVTPAAAAGARGGGERARRAVRRAGPPRSFVWLTPPGPPRPPFCGAGGGQARRAAIFALVPQPLSPRRHPPPPPPDGPRTAPRPWPRGLRGDCRAPSAPHPPGHAAPPTSSRTTEECTWQSRRTMRRHPAAPRSLLVRPPRFPLAPPTPPSLPLPSPPTTPQLGARHRGEQPLAQPGPLNAPHLLGDGGKPGAKRPTTWAPPLIYPCTRGRGFRDTSPLPAAPRPRPGTERARPVRAGRNPRPGRGERDPARPAMCWGMLREGSGAPPALGWRAAGGRGRLVRRKRGSTDQPRPSCRAQRLGPGRRGASGLASWPGRRDVAADERLRGIAPGELIVFRVRDTKERNQRD